MTDTPAGDTRTGHPPRGLWCAVTAAAVGGACAFGWWSSRSPALFAAGVAAAFVAGAAAESADNGT